MYPTPRFMEPYKNLYLPCVVFFYLYIASKTLTPNIKKDNKMYYMVTMICLLSSLYNFYDTDPLRMFHHYFVPSLILCILCVLLIFIYYGNAIFIELN